jgi:energy-coupling factor transporter ATP-binding protein EcfA2
VDALVVEDLSKRYGPTAAVDGLSFAVPKGSVCGFLGPNGAGKTTTLRILFGLTKASAGRAEAIGRVSGVLDRDGFHPGRTARDELALAARRQQVAYRAIAAHPEWDADVHARVPQRLQAALDANVDAARQLRALTKPRPALPPWHIVAPAPRDELLADYHEADRATGVPWAYLAAIHLVETRMGRIRGDSTAGARGPMQFLPSTWAAYGDGGDIESNRDAIFTAARYLKANGAPADMAKAIWNYNHSDRYVRAVTRYAERMLADPAAYAAYWHWDVYYRLASGDVLLPVGWTGP